MSKKNFVFAALLFTLIAAMASARGGQSQSRSGTASDGRMPITVTSYQLGPLAEQPKMLEFINNKFNVDLQVWNIDQANYDELMNLHFAANEIPDFFRTTKNNLQKYYDQGLLAEISEDLFKARMPKVYKEWNDIYPGVLNLYKINGKIYMLPSTLSMPYRAPAAYRGDWITAVGKQRTPDTLAEFEELMYLFTNNDPDKNGRKDTYGLSAAGFNMVYGAFGYIPGQWKNKNGQLVYSSIQPEMKEALGLLAKWYRDGVIDPEFITGENKGGYWAVSHAFIEGRIGFTTHASYYHYWDIVTDKPNYTGKDINPAAAETIVFGNPVTGSAGKKGLFLGGSIDSNANAFGVQMEKEPAKVEKIYEIYNWMTEDSANWVTTFYGFQGEDWDYVDGVPVPFEGHGPGYINPQGGHMVMIKFETPRLRSAIEPKMSSWLDAHGFYKDGYQDELLVQQPSAGIYKTEIDKLELEAYVAIITGDRPLSYFDEFVAQWRRAGGDIMTKEANAWWDSVK
jgi:putative aldouronate transport system substrate-binding protein